MTQLDLNKVTDYVAQNIEGFHSRRLERLNDLSLPKVLKRKNPYLFKAKDILTAQDLVTSILDAYLSSQEETIFGEFLEGLAIFVCENVYGGRKSIAEGVDLEFDNNGIRYIVAIKSGPNWGNSSQKKRMLDNFKQAKRIIRTQAKDMNIVAVNGCCYGKDNRPDKGDYLKLCGQRFWEFISENKELYIQIIEPLGYQAKQRNDKFKEEYAKLVNRFTYDFMGEYCLTNGEINWEKLVAYNSGKN